MSDFNLSLWGAGAAVILVVIGYNFWQEYRAKKNVERAFGEHQDDVLMKTDAPATAQPRSRQEPTFNEQAEFGDETNHGDESTGQTIPADFADTDFILNGAEKNALLVDEFIECVISIEFEQPLRGDKILNEVQSFRLVGNKPVQFIGINSVGKQEVISHATSYTQLLVGTLLVSRSGALNELEYSELVMQLKVIAENLNAYLDIPDMKHVMDAGRDLHLFVTEHDAQLSVNVHTNGAPWAIHTLLAALEKQGFDARPDGRLVMPDGDGGSLYHLSTNGGLADQVTSRITLLLDVPCVAPGRGAFKAMISCAKSLALRLGGSLVDDGNSALNDVTLDQIQEQVELFYSAMQAADIPAGSVRAIKIFS